MRTSSAAVPGPTGRRMGHNRQSFCVSKASRRPARSTGSRRLDQSVDVKVELERRAAAERKARRKTYGIESEERVDVEEEREQFKDETPRPDGLPHTDSGEGVDKGFRNTGGSTDITDPIIDVSTTADENSNTDHDSALSTSLGGNAVGEADDSPGVCSPVTDETPSRDVKSERKLKAAWCELKGRMRKPFRSRS
ncbi:uncharacterized protein NECHADRAFT_75614 [Fusarium vanettenii 77-13-4]|uniref:Uncharacterized protein n=1 Tax=Fusarium vanettenii (strain ATCC MYA-4622 / CBS 123669 / FGSC 9596 / NRRL 45880 / 77-13-4) TaxID=660122 RepID=C7YJA8_FUSV7|nr:uncharacterized protein NECHADRAFT_75614 [Fusarium vanettenii 77-13-4]EEU48947.1 predicted protein [Fusarium vanettenii 77-13-4]